MRDEKGQSAIQIALVVLVIISLVGSWMAYSSAGAKKASTKGLAEKKNVRKLKNRISSLEKKVKALKKGQNSILKKLGVKRAKITVRSIEIPSKVSTGKETTVRAIVKNEGKKKGSKTIKLKVAGKVRDRRKVTLNPGEKTKVSLKTTLEKAGKYPVIVGTQIGTITVGKPGKKRKITLKAYLAAPKSRWDDLIPKAEKKFEAKHPNIDINVKYMVFPYGKMHQKLTTMSSAMTRADIVSVDQIWLGEFAEAKYFRDITDEVKKWGIREKLYPSKVKGCKYKNKFYGVWAWTDERLLWYWKDSLEKAGVEPSDLKTWKGFLKAMDKMKDAGLRVAFPGAAWITDWWYGFLFEKGGSILEKKNGTWKAGFAGKPGIESAKFLKDMKKAGVEFPTTWRWGDEFGAKTYDLWFGGSWVLGHVPEKKWDEVGCVPFPKPTGGKTRTLAGGWILANPVTSKHPKIAWKFIKAMLNPDVLTSVLVKHTYLPTQKKMATKPKYANQFKEKFPKDIWSTWRNTLPTARMRPNMPEYPEVASKIASALQKIVAKGAPVEETISHAAEQVNAIFKE